MRLVEKHIFYKSNKRFNSLDNICFLSKNLYNAALFKIKNHFEINGKWIRYNELEKDFRINNNIDYISLPNNSSQQTLMLLDTNLKSYFRALKAFKKSKTSFTGCPKFPNYKHKTNGRNVVIFTSVQFRFKEEYIYFPKKSGISPIKTKLSNDTKIHQVRIIPKNNSYIIEIVYHYNEIIKDKLNNEYLGIDLGVNNLASCVTTKGNIPFIINGKPLKSINQYYNKKKSEYQNKLGFYINNKGEKQQLSKSKRITRLTNKRNNKINDYLHKSSKMIINYCKENQIDNLVLGKNEGWKQEINIGKRNNQNFVQIPFNLFESYLRYKSMKEGINFITREESYTSKSSSMDLDFIPDYKRGNGNKYKFSGKRVCRGLYKSEKGLLLNADINGSINILRKEIGDDWLKPIILNRGFVIDPIKVIPL